VHDALGNRTSVTDANGNTTSFAYSSRAWRTSETDAEAGVTEFGYDEVGNRTTVTNPRDKTWTYAFNWQGRVKQLTQPGNRIEKHAFDATGREIAKYDGNGATIKYEHDKLGRLTKKDYPTGTDTTFAYNALGLRTSMTDSTGTTEYEYDDVGRVTSVTAPVAGGKNVSYIYTAVGTRATMTDPDDGETTYTYNAGNRLTSLTNPLDETTDFTYDALGRLTRQDNENGTYSTWTFDDAGRGSAVATKKSDDTVILSMSYTRDNVGNPTSVSEALLDTDDQTTHNATLTYTYDDLHRLTSEKRTTYQPIWYEYTMDAAGNRTQFVEKDQQGNVVGTTNATYSDDNRLLTYGNLDYDWDDNGNLTSKTVNQVETTYGWDYENKLTSLTDGSALSFIYNGDGLRQSKTVDGTTTRFVYSGVRLLQETNSGGTTQATYTLAPMGGQWEPLVSHRKSGASRWYAFDALGTTRALTDGSESVAAVFTDDAWGNVLNASDSTATAHQYVGRYGYYLDGASGLQLLTQRYYDPAAGRFVSEDPARDASNWLGYVGASPSTEVDPAGLHTDEQCTKECQAEFDDDLAECRKKFKKCKKQCLCSLILWPVCVYFVCTPKLTVCIHEATTDYGLCTTWCGDPDVHTSGADGPHGPNPHVD
jgi:RHS repeat-associated protein